MDTARDIRILSGNKNFANFLLAVKQMRENNIARLRSADTNEIQQIAGSIIAFDEILEMCDLDIILKKTEFIPD